MKWIAVDYGDARTGLAASDATELLATPLTPQIEEKSMNKAAAAAAGVIARQGAGGVVVGLPRNMDGTEGARAAKSRRFAARLAAACGNTNRASSLALAWPSASSRRLSSE